MIVITPRGDELSATNQAIVYVLVGLLVVALGVVLTNPFSSVFGTFIVYWGMIVGAIVTVVGAGLLTIPNYHGNQKIPKVLIGWGLALIGGSVLWYFAAPGCVVGCPG